MKKLLFAALAMLSACSVNTAHGPLAKPYTYAPHDKRTRTVEPYKNFEPYTLAKRR